MPIDPNPPDDAGRRPIPRPVAFDVDDQLGAADVPAVALERRHVARLYTQIEEFGELSGSFLAIATDPQALCILAGMAIDDMPSLTLESDVAARTGVVAIFGHAAKLLRRGRCHLRQHRRTFMPIRPSVRLHARAVAQGLVRQHFASGLGGAAVSIRGLQARSGPTPLMESVPSAGDRAG